MASLDEETVPTNEPLIAPMSDDSPAWTATVNQLCGLNLSREDISTGVITQGPILVTVAPGDTYADLATVNGKKITVYYDRLAANKIIDPDLGVESARTTQAYIAKARKPHDNGLSLSPDEIVISGVGPIDRYQPDLTLSSKALVVALIKATTRSYVW
ncbi:hypothetical protein SPFM8_00162 [Salmonella phage SPFM8]|nr:hypothetical protein SPFM8_00162 [Salmonella phage SPFM8]